MTDRVQITRSLLRLIVVIVLFAGAVEGIATLICQALLALPQTKPIFWRPDLDETLKNWAKLSASVDDEIGGVRATGSDQNSDVKRSCGSAFGDSFVGGAEVSDGQGWVDQLSHLLGCHITNYAVGGYGTDQVYLRFRRMDDSSPIAIFGVNPNSVMDIINQYDALLGSPAEPASLKGRFLLDATDQLSWLARPKLDENQFIALNQHPASFLPKSYFLPDTPEGPITLRFPRILALLRIVQMKRVRDVFLRRAEWSSLYDAEHPSGALRLMTAICEAFVNQAKARKQQPLIVMLPLAHSFREKWNYGKFEYEPLVTALRAEHITVFDPGSAMIDSLAGRSVCELYTHPHPGLAWFTSPAPCGGHYSVAGNTMMAKLVADEIQRLDLLKN
jgi:hypothetical protein